MPNPNRLTYSWMAKAAGAPGHSRAILFEMPIPKAMESHKMLSETKAVARERYQNTFGSVPISDVAMLGSHVGSNKIAVIKPTIMASMIIRKNWMLTDDSYSFSAGGIAGILFLQTFARFICFINILPSFG